MNNEVALKVYDVDYSFIISNYLSPDLWNKEWTLFVYRDVVISLMMSTIDVKDRTICFRIILRKGTHTDYGCIWYNLSTDNINVLKKQINGAMRDCISGLENYLIRQEDGYKRILQAEDNEIELLESIANEFLDENGVSNDDIREVYRDDYVSKNNKTCSHLDNYLYGRKYKNQTDLWLMFYKAIGNDNKFNEIKNIVGETYDFSEIMEEIEIFENQDSEEYEEYVSEMRDNLESL